jgi:hypothetical protein
MQSHSKRAFQALGVEPDRQSHQGTHDTGHRGLSREHLSNIELKSGHEIQDDRES